MPFRIVRNDITKMNTEAIVNTASDHPAVGPGCDLAVYNAAGYDRLLSYRKENIGYVPEGGAFITPGFDLKAKYIIHAVSPFYMGGGFDEEAKLRSCYRESLALAKENGISSISFPLISTGGFGYHKEEGMRIAVDEISAFLLGAQMDIYLVVFDTKATRLGESIYPELRTLIDQSYVKEKQEEEYGYAFPDYSEFDTDIAEDTAPFRPDTCFPQSAGAAASAVCDRCPEVEDFSEPDKPFMNAYAAPKPRDVNWEDDIDAVVQLNDALKERITHMSDTFSEYLLYLIEQKGMTNPDVYKRAIIDKRYFAKLKKNRDFHPEKLKALCLCVGAQLSLDETRDLLARAGYALSPCDPVDIIFSVYIENKFYSVIDIDILLEDLGLPCIIT